MFGRSKPVVFDRYASRRSRKWIPNWLWLLLFGAAAGAAAVIYVQQQHLPPRLSAAASGRLQTAFDTAEQARLRLSDELARTRTELQAAQAAQTRLAGELASARREPDALRGHIELLLAALPPDPRGGAVQVRAARLSADGAALGYNVVLSRSQAGAAPFNGVLQLAVAGRNAKGSEATVTLDPVQLAVGRYQIVNGSLPLPAGFVPRQATLRVLDRVDGRAFGMRVVYVQ